MRLAALALVVLGDEGRAKPLRADVPPQEDERVRTALRALTSVSDRASLVEGVADVEVHQTIRLTRFQPTKIIEAAASQRRRRMYHGFCESSSRRPPRGRARRSDNSLIRFSSLMRRAYHRDAV